MFQYSLSSQTSNPKAKLPGAPLWSRGAPPDTPPRACSHLAVGVSERAGHIRPVDRRHVGDVLPVASLQVLEALVRRRLVGGAVGQLVEVAHRHGVFLYVDLGVGAESACDHLRQGSGRTGVPSDGVREDNGNELGSIDFGLDIYMCR